MSVAIYNTISVIIGVLLVAGLIVAVVWTTRTVQKNINNSKHKSNGGKK